MTRAQPAILGGPPAFPQSLRQLRPTLPPLAGVQRGLEKAFASGVLTKGPALAAYEGRLADHLGVARAIAMSSCTAGLMLALTRFRGGEAVLPSFTFMATAMAVTWAGLEPVFCDIDRETWCLDPVAVEHALSERTAVIIPVHVFGNPADTDAFADLSARHKVPVVYDAAHGFGALRGGAPVARDGLAQVFSTSPTKLLITGEGGVVATDDDVLAEHIVVGREYGNPGTYNALFAGLNARLPEPSALIGLASLDLLEGEASRRNELAAIYRDSLGRLPGVSFQRVRPEDRSSFKDFTIRVGAGFGLTRDELAAALYAEGIDTRAYYVPPVHRQRAFADLTAMYEPVLPETVALSAEALTLPLYGALDEEDVERVGTCIIALHDAHEAVRAALRTRATATETQVSGR